MKIKRSTAVLILEISIIYLLSIISSIVFWNNAESGLRVVSWITNIVYLFSIYKIYKRDNDYLDFGIIFLTLLFLFCNGQFLLYSFGVTENELSIFKYNYNDLMKCETYFLFSYLSISLPFIVRKKSSKKVYNNETGVSALDKSIKTFAIILIIIFSIPFLSPRIGNFLISTRYGYDYIYYGDVENISFGNIIGYFSNLFMVGLFLLLYACRNEKAQSRIVMLFLLALVMLYMITGLRGSALTLLICIMLMYFKFINTDKKAKNIIAPIIIIFTIIAIPIIKDFRASTNKTIDSFSSYASISSGGDSIIRTISELGGSAKPFMMVEHIVPAKYPYKYGLSYISSLFAMLPSSVYGTTFFTDNASLDIWLMDAYSMSYGPGFSIMAESYYNFGYYGGILFSLLLGIILSKTLYYQSKNIKYHSINYVFSVVFLLMSLMTVRGSFFHVPKCIVFLMIIPFLIIVGINNRNTQNKGKE